MGSVSRCVFQPGEKIASQGDPGESLIVVLSGSVDVHLNMEDEPLMGKTTNGLQNGVPNNGTARGEIVKTISQGEMFGQEAMLFDHPWRHSYFCKEGSAAVCARLNRQSAHILIHQEKINQRDRRRTFLKDVKLFETFNDQQLTRMVDSLRSRFFKAGDKIIEQDAKANRFFIVRSGECKAEVLTGTFVKERME